MEQPGGGFIDYVWLSCGVLVGTLARFGQWWNQDDTFNWRKAVSELMAVPGIGAVAGGLVKYYAPNVDPVIMGGLGAAAGLLGVVTIQALVQRWAGAKIDGGKL